MSDVTTKDEQIVGLKVELATLQDKLRNKIEEVDYISNSILCYHPPRIMGAY